MGIEPPAPDPPCCKGCFAADSIVRVKNYRDEVIEKELKYLHVNDEVESFDTKTGKVTFSRVYSIMHEDDENPSRTVLCIKYRADQPDQGEIHITGNHVIYIKGPLGKRTVQAKKIREGDWLYVRCGDELVPRQVTEISKQENVEILLPLTINHHIIVNGVHASAHVYNDRAMRIMTWGLRKPAFEQSALFRRIRQAFY